MGFATGFFGSWTKHTFNYRQLLFRKKYFEEKKKNLLDLPPMIMTARGESLTWQFQNSSQVSWHLGRVWIMKCGKLTAKMPDNVWTISASTIAYFSLSQTFWCGKHEKSGRKAHLPAINEKFFTVRQSLGGHHRPQKTQIIPNYLQKANIVTECVQ